MFLSNSAPWNLESFLSLYLNIADRFFRFCLFGVADLPFPLFFYSYFPVPAQRTCSTLDEQMGKSVSTRGTWSPGIAPLPDRRLIPLFFVT